jgi:hypothetical protein
MSNGDNHDSIEIEHQPPLDVNAERMERRQRWAVSNDRTISATGRLVSS